MYVIKKLRKNEFKQVRVQSAKDLFARVGARMGAGVTTSVDPDKCSTLPLNQRKLDTLANAEYIDSVEMQNALIQAENSQNDVIQDSTGSETNEES